MVMGPACGMFLSFLGAEVIKVEPIAGDKTRNLRGIGLPMFPLFNRGKKSLKLDIHSEEGKEHLEKLLLRTDILIENFKDGSLAKMGLDPDALRKRHPKLILCMHKGYLSGPYKNRTALDEVVQMMTGLAHMTGPKGQPLRVGSSVNDIMGGLFGAFAILATLQEREKTGLGRTIRVGLFETCLVLVAQHMVYAELAGEPASPMPEREHSWPIYDIFKTKDNKRIFVGVVTDVQWTKICNLLSLETLLEHPDLETPVGRLSARDWIVPEFAIAIHKFKCDALQADLEVIGIPFAVVGTPSDMFKDPHVMREGGLVQSVTPDGVSYRAPALPFEIDGQAVCVNGSLPDLGEHNDEILKSLSPDAPVVDTAPIKAVPL